MSNLLLLGYWTPNQPATQIRGDVVATTKTDARPVKSSAGLNQSSAATTDANQPSIDMTANGRVSQSNGEDTAALNLELPEIELQVPEAKSNAIVRQRNSVEFQDTQFNQHWKPTSDPITKLKWKSKSVNFILKAFGGNKKICTEQDIKRQDPECVGPSFRPSE